MEGGSESEQSLLCSDDIHFSPNALLKIPSYILHRSASNYLEG